MAEFFDEQGNKVEAFTAEEVADKLEEERLAAIEDANSARQDEIDELTKTLEEKEQALAEAQEALDKEKDKDKNLGGQRKIIESKEEEIKKLKEDLANTKTEITQVKEEVTKKIGEEKINNMIDKISEGSNELKEKIKFYYDNFKGEPQDDKEITERLKNAYILATGGQSSVKLTGEMISGTGEPPIPKTEIPQSKISEEAISLAKKMGITDQDLKKHKLI